MHIVKSRILKFKLANLRVLGYYVMMQNSTLYNIYNIIHHIINFDIMNFCEKMRFEMLTGEIYNEAIGH